MKQSAMNRWRRFHQENPSIERFELSLDDYENLQKEVREWWAERGDLLHVANIPEENFLFRGLPVVILSQESR